MNLTHFPIIPSLNFGGKTGSQLEAKNFFETKFFFQAEKLEAKIFFQAKKFEAKIFFQAKKFFTSREIDPREESYPLSLKASA